MNGLEFKGTWMEEVLIVQITDSGEINISIDKTYDHDVSITKHDAVKLANHILLLCQ